MLQLQHMQEKFAGRIHILAVSLDYEPAPVQRFLEEHSLTVPVLMDRPGGAADSYGIRAIPSLVLVDHRGSVRYRHAGYPGDATLTSELEALLKEVNTK